MTAPRLPAAEAVISRLADEITATPANEGAAWAVDGPATTGKSAVLRMLADRLRDQKVGAVLSAPPAQALDAGPMVLAELAGGLKDGGFVNGQTEMLRDGSIPLQDMRTDLVLA